MSETPRTDAVHDREDAGYNGMKRHAATLERELAAMTAAKELAERQVDGLSRHDDLDNPPDYETLRDDYWLLWDRVAGKQFHTDNSAIRAEAEGGKG